MPVSAGKTTLHVLSLASAAAAVPAEAGWEEERQVVLKLIIPPMFLLLRGILWQVCPHCVLEAPTQLPLHLEGDILCLLHLKYEKKEPTVAYPIH